MTDVKAPTFDTLMNPVIEALRSLGGSGTIEEINSRASDIAGLSDEQLEVLHNPEKGGQTEVEYRLAWTRTYLKKYGMLENSSRGVWALTPKGRQLDRVNPRSVKRYVQEQMRKARAASEVEDLEETEEEASWRDALLDTLLQMEPSAFERLVQRLLRESGFIQVQVTGRSGDGGIDGKGIMRLVRATFLRAFPAPLIRLFMPSYSRMALHLCQRLCRRPTSHPSPPSNLPAFKLR
jgi:restriction system protein